MSKGKEHTQSSFTRCIDEDFIVPQYRNIPEILYRERKKQLRHYGRRGWNQESASSISRNSLCIMTRPSFFSSNQNCLDRSFMWVMGGSSRKSWPRRRGWLPCFTLMQSDRESCRRSWRLRTVSPGSRPTSVNIAPHTQPFSRPGGLYTNS